MIVTDKGIILIHDEVMGSSVAGKKSCCTTQLYA